MRTFIVTVEAYQQFIASANYHSKGAIFQEEEKTLPRWARYVVFEDGNLYDPTFYANYDAIEIEEE